jgi:2-phosphosulfolactate phosphatase
VRFEWGVAGVEALARAGGVVVVVDVLRFTTAVDVAVGHGLRVQPYRWRDDSVTAFAASLEAVVADGDQGRPSLSPGSLRALAPGSRVVLPSPNGATCAAVAAEAGATVVAACLRNAAAVAGWLREQAAPVAVIACGERWPDGALRPALEDLLGAGAVLSALPGAHSPEAQAATAAWHAARDRVPEVVAACSSGREQTVRGWSDDLHDAVQVDASPAVPLLLDGAFLDAR